MILASGKSAAPILMVGGAVVGVEAGVLDAVAWAAVVAAAVGELLPPPVEQALNSTSIDAPRASVRDSRIGSSPSTPLPFRADRLKGRPTIAVPRDRVQTRQGGAGTANQARSARYVGGPGSDLRRRP